MKRGNLTKEDVGGLFHQFIRKHFVTQEQAADYFDVRQSFISNIVTGRSWPNEAMLLAMQLVKNQEIVVCIDRSLPKFKKEEK